MVSLTACGGAEAERSSRDDPAAATGAAAFEAARNRAFRLVDAGAPPEQALAALREAHALDPTAFGVNARLGALCVELKLYGEALGFHAAALAAHPDDRVSRREVVWLALQLGDPTRALAEVEPLLAGPEPDGEACYLKAMAADQLGRRSQARAALSELPEQGAASALVLRGRFALEAGELPAARSDLERALAQRPDDQAALRALADTCRRAGDDAAAAHWDEVLSLFVALRDNRFTRPASGRAERKLQRQAQRKNEYIAAEVAAHERRLRRLLELHPDWREGYEQLADTLTRADRDQDACAVIDALLARHGQQMDPTNVANLRRRYCGGESQ
ncbi:MAG: hypothetical protein DRQ55_04375 [Planctomycetota bacterium]|nr:MAG: hypothetical protein DRQ55_04375 [Planctomycetota bacterium]